MSGMDGLDAAGRALQRAFLDHELDLAQRFWQRLARDPNLRATDFAAAHPFVAPTLDESADEAAPAAGRQDPPR